MKGTVGFGTLFEVNWSEQIPNLHRDFDSDSMWGQKAFVMKRKRGSRVRKKRVAVFDMSKR